jgi:uncharacterized damage-inducible protein DinB
MIELLRHLFQHEAWADAEHWREIAACSAALEDSEIKGRLHHIHLVQRAYLKMLRGERLDVQKEMEPFPTLNDLRLSARQCHEQMTSWIDGLDPGRLATVLDLPWFKGHQPTVSDALLQVVMHSQYHRGQNATRLKQLGGKPRLTDFVSWVDRGRPDQQWA